MKEGWQWTTIGETLKIVRGISFPKESRSTNPAKGYIACLRTANVQRFVEWGDLWYVPEKFVKREDQKIQLYDILISTANSKELVGKVAQVNKIVHPATLGAFISLIRVPSGINQKYIYYQLSSPRVQKELHNISSTTTNISNISTSKLTGIKIILPSFNEQERIVEKIEELFTQLDAGEAALKRVQSGLKRYKASVLKAAFEGRLVPQDPSDEPPEVTVKRLGKKILNPDNFSALPVGWCWATPEILVEDRKYSMKAGPFGSSLKKEFYTSKGFKIYGQEQVIRGDAFYGDYFIGQERFELLKSNSVQPGDVLISLVGTIGKVLILPEGIEPGIINPRLVKFSFNKSLIDNQFFKYFMETSIAHNHFSKVSHGETMEILNLGILKNLPIPLPPLTEQKRIVEEVEKEFSLVQDFERTINSNLNRNVKLRQTILNQAFRGKLL